MPEKPDTPEPIEPAPAPLPMDERSTPKWAQDLPDNLNRNAKAGAPTP